MRQLYPVINNCKVTGNLSGRFGPCIIALIFCLCAFSANGQNRAVDSLSSIIKNAESDTSVAAAYVALTEIYYASKPDTVIPLCNKALAVVEKNIKKANEKERRSLLLSKADALNNTAYIYQLRGKLWEALGAYIEVLGIYEEIDIKERIPIALNNIGVVYYKQGQIEKSLDYYHRSLTMRESLGDKSGVAQSLSNIGAIYNVQGQRDKALEYFQRSLDIRKSINDQNGMAFSLNNLGAVYRSMGQMEKARTNYEECMRIYDTLDSQEGLANTFHNIGSTYEDADPQTALPYFQKSLAIYESISDKRGIANSSINIAIALLKLSKPKEALEYGNRSLKNAQEGGFAESIRNAHLILKGIDSAMGNPTGAFEHYKQYIFYRDSIANETTRKKGIEKQIQYEYDTKEALLKSAQEEELKRKELINWIIGISLGLAFLFALLVFNRYRLKQKNQHQKELNQQQKNQAIAVMETQEQERKRIAEDLHDSLGHLLSATKMNLQTFPENQKHLMENPLQLLDQASLEIRNITFNLMPRTLEEEGLVPALHELATKTANSGIEISLQVHGMENLVLEKQAQFNIYRIIQEAVNNILKHAKASEITVQLIHRDKQLTIMVEDNGSGFDPELLKKKGRGLTNIMTRSAWLNGTTSIDSGPGRGTTIVIEIPNLS